MGQLCQRSSAIAETPLNGRILPASERVGLEDWQIDTNQTNGCHGLGSRQYGV